VALSAREASALPVSFATSFYVVSSPSPLDPLGCCAGTFDYETDTNVLSYVVNQEIRDGLPWVASSFRDATGAAISISERSSSVDTDDSSYYSSSGSLVLGDEASEAGLLAGHWYYSTSSVYGTWRADLIPTPEPPAPVLIALVLAALLARRSR